MPNELSLHHTMTFCLCKGDWCCKQRFPSAQYLKFCLHKNALHLMLSSSEEIAVVCLSFSIARCKSPCTYSNHKVYIIWILNGWKCKSTCNVLLTLLSDTSSATECPLAERCGLCCRATWTLSTFSGLLTYHGQTGFFFGKAEAFDLIWLIKFKMFWRIRTLPFLPMLKCFTLCLNSRIIIFRKALQSKYTTLTWPTLHGMIATMSMMSTNWL
jgi:hypothetical protein